MTTYEKIVKGATKLKVAAPKPKYIEPILMATLMNHQLSGENFNTIMKTLHHRLQDSSWLVVYKSLIVIHIMIREGDRDVTLKYLAEQAPNMLNLAHYNIGKNHTFTTDVRFIMKYGKYLHTRVKHFSETQMDYVRDERVNNLTNQLGGRLRTLQVEKGLLRECESVQKQIDALLKNSFLENEIKNDIVLTAFRLLVNDLLALFQELNEGVINILEHYFEMFRVDAERALKVYKKFVDQTKYVIDYLRVAKHLEYATKLHVPTIKHAPTALTSLLEEYLDDPNFEANRRQYLADKKPAQASASSPVKAAAELQKQPQVNGVQNGINGVQNGVSQPVALQQFLYPIQGNIPTQDVNAQRHSSLIVQQTYNPWGTVQPQQPPTQTIVPAFTGTGFGGYGQNTGSNPFGQPQLQLQPQTTQPFQTLQPQATQTYPVLAQQPTQPFQQQATQVFQQQPTQPFQQQPTQAFQQQPTQQFQLQPSQFFQQQPTQQFQPQQVQPQLTQPIQSQVTGLQRSNTNPFALLAATATGNVAVNPSNPFGNTRFANNQTTAFSFQQTPQRVSVTATGSNPFMVSQTTTNVFDSAAQQKQPALKAQPTAGGLENLPTVPVFPQTQQEQVRNAYIDNARMNLNQQATGQLQQHQLMQQQQQQWQLQQIYNGPSLI